MKGDLVITCTQQGEEFYLESMPKPVTYKSKFGSLNSYL